MNKFGYLSFILSFILFLEGSSVTAIQCIQGSVRFRNGVDISNTVNNTNPINITECPETNHICHRFEVKRINETENSKSLLKQPCNDI